MTIYEQHKLLQEQLAMAQSGVTLFEYYKTQYAKDPTAITRMIISQQYLCDEQAKIEQKIAKVEKVITLVEQLVKEQGL